MSAPPKPAAPHPPARRRRQHLAPLGAAGIAALLALGPRPGHADPGDHAPASPASEGPARAAWLPLARAALAAGDLERAGRALAGARACFLEHGEACGFARAAYEALLGVVYFEAGEHARAAETLDRAVAARPDDAALWLALAQSRAALEQWPAADAAFAQAEARGEHRPAVYALWARARRAGGDAFGPVAILARGLLHHPDHPLLARELALHFARHGAFAAAQATAERAVRPAADASANPRPDPDPELGAESQRLWRALASARLDAGDPRGAALTLERARLDAPDDLELQARHAAALAAAGEAHAAHRLLARLARRDPRHAAAAAEQARRAGDLPAALRLNLRVPEAELRTRQRLDLLLAAERPAAALALVPEAALAGRATPEADALRQRLAWAALQTGDAARAQRLAQAITTPALRPLAHRLLEAARACLDRAEGC